MLLLKENGVPALLKLIEAFKKNIGKIKTGKLLKDNPKMFFELLNSDCVIDTGTKETVKGKGKPKSVQSLLNWDDTNYNENYRGLKLTKCQKIILLSILKSNKSPTLDQLKESVEKKGIKIDNGSIIGGSIAGITKKCRAYNIPEIFQNNPGDYKYSLNLSNNLKDKIKTILQKDL